MAPVSTCGKAKGPSVSQQQKQVLAKYMVANRAFAQGEFDRHADGQKAYEDEWKKLSEVLNNLEGPVKDVIGWQECWKGQRKVAKEKGTAYVKALNRTGGGGEKELPEFSDYHRSIVDTMGGLTRICGKTEVPDPFYCDSAMDEKHARRSSRSCSGDRRRSRERRDSSRERTHSSRKRRDSSRERWDNSRRRRDGSDRRVLNSGRRGRDRSWDRVGRGSSRGRDRYSSLDRGSSRDRWVGGSGRRGRDQDHSWDREDRDYSRDRRGRKSSRDRNVGGSGRRGRDQDHSWDREDRDYSRDRRGRKSSRDRNVGGSGRRGRELDCSWEREDRANRYRNGSRDRRGGSSGRRGRDDSGWGSWNKSTERKKRDCRERRQKNAAFSSHKIIGALSFNSPVASGSTPAFLSGPTSTSHAASATAEQDDVSLGCTPLDENINSSFLQATSEGVHYDFENLDEVLVLLDSLPSDEESPMYCITKVLRHIVLLLKAKISK